MSYAQAHASMQRRGREWACQPHFFKPHTREGRFRTSIWFVPAFRFLQLT